MPNGERKHEPRLTGTPIEEPQNPDRAEEDRVDHSSPHEALGLQWQALRQKQLERVTRLATLLAESKKEPSDEGDEATSWSFDDLIAQIDEIHKQGEHGEPRECLRALKVIQQRIGKLEMTLNKDWDVLRDAESDLYRKIHQSERSLNQLQSHLQELSQSHLLKRIFFSAKRRRLIQELNEGEARHNARKDQRVANSTAQDEKRLELRRASELHQTARSIFYKKEKDLFSQTARQELLNIERSYQDFFQAIEQDHDFFSEINERYIEEEIAPLVEATKGRNHNPSPIPEDRFYELLRTFVIVGDPEVQAQQKKELDAMLTQHYNVDMACHELVKGLGRATVLKLLEMMEGKDVAFVENFTKGKLGEYWESDRFGHDDGNTSLPFHHRGIRWRNQEPPPMPFWRALRSAPASATIFGDAVKEIDDHLFSSFLGESWEDSQGTQIDRLEYFSRPETVRALVVLAAADHGNYRTVHANAALTALRKQPNWPQLLEAAEIQFPSLVGLHEILISWDFSGSDHHPALRKEAGSLASGIMKDQSEDPRLRARALEVLPISDLIRFGEQEGLVSGMEATIIEKADRIVRGTPSEQQLKDKSFDEDFSVLLDFIRSNLLTVVRSPVVETNRSLVRFKSRHRMSRMVAFLREIKEGETNAGRLRYLKYLACESKKFFDHSLNDEDVQSLIQAAEGCPRLMNDDIFRRKFFEHFKGAETLAIFKQISEALPSSLGSEGMIDLILTKKITLERVRELGVKVPDLLQWSCTELATQYPELFLSTDDGLDHLRAIKESGFSGAPSELDQRAGQRWLASERIRPGDHAGFNLSPLERQRAMRYAYRSEHLIISDQNWIPFLLAFIHEGGLGYDIDQTVMMQKIQTLFQGNEAKDFCLNAIQTLWRDYLRSSDPEQLSFRLSVLASEVHREGAETLSQIESLLEYIYAYRKSLVRKTTTPRTHQKVFQGIGTMEDRFQKERWSREDQADFYHISSDLMAAAPSLFVDVLELLSARSPAQLKRFSQEIYPLLRAKLALLEKKGKTEEEKTHPVRELAGIRRGVRKLGKEMNEHGTEAFSEARNALIGDISTMFKEKFGIIKLPENFSEDQVHSLTNVSIYLANFNDRTPERETVLGFYLALMINGDWDRFRAGEEVDPAQYLVAEKSDVVKAMLEKRKANNPLTPDRCGIDAATFPSFQSVLQQETQAVVIGEVETVDVKLSNVLTNLESLSDPDFYPDSLDKTRMRLLLEFGNKRVGSTAAKMFQELERPDRRMAYKEEEGAVKEAIDVAMKIHGLDKSLEAIKQHFQDGVRQLSVIVNVLQFSREIGARQEVEKLRALLSPTAEVVAVFNRLGEEFKVTSGAMALTQDLNYLDNLVVKREKDLRPEEKTMLVDYIKQIRDQLKVCEGIYEQVKNKVGSLKTSQVHASNPLLKEKLREIDRIVNADATQTAITTTLTSDLNRVIENIRECLSCKNQGCNNDTNLTFGDSNKFFIYSRTENQEKAGSVSDQILYLEPMTLEDQTAEMAFVFDRLYGSQTPSIAMNHVATVLKKIRQLRTQFPKFSPSVLIPNGVFPGGGVSSETLQKKITSELGSGVEIREGNFTAEIAPSAAGDHYLEFGGGGARAFGKRSVSGWMLRFV